MAWGAEDRLQIAAAELLDTLGLRWMHVPNGGSRNKIEAVKLKRMGVKRGFPDIVIFTPPPALDNVKGVLIELKVKDNNLSLDQVEWMIELCAIGWYYDVAYSMQEVESVLRLCGYL